MKRCKVKALVELDGVTTQPFQGVSKSAKDDQMLRDIREDFITAMKLHGESAEIRIIVSVEEEQKARECLICEGTGLVLTGLEDERIIKICLRDGVLEILEKIGKDSYDVLHVGVVNEVCSEHLEKLLGGKIKEFVIK